LNNPAGPSILVRTANAPALEDIMRTAATTHLRCTVAIAALGVAASALTAATLLATAGTAAEPGTGAATGARVSPDCTQPGPYQLPRGSSPVHLDPAQFTTTIDNPYWPRTPGTTWRYVERGGGSVAKVTTTVTLETKVIEGVTARVVHDTVREHHQVVEDTRDWYAQDSGGSIWYLGERSVTYEDGRPVSTEGSWEHGRHGAQAGVIVPANPGTECRYREEFRPGVARDQALVLSTRESLKGPTGFDSRVLHTANTTPLDRTVLENKFYARGEGPVLELDLSPDLGSAVLMKVTHKPAAAR
jgi:hypothetical protein